MEFKYQDGLIPAIIQDKHSGKVLMLGYMNGEAYDQAPCAAARRVERRQLRQDDCRPAPQPARP